MNAVTVVQTMTNEFALTAAELVEKHCRSEDDAQSQSSSGQVRPLSLHHIHSIQAHYYTVPQKPDTNYSVSL